MVKLGEIIHSIYMVIEITNAGRPVRYLNIQTGKRILTDYGVSVLKKRKTISLSDKDLEVLAETMTIEKYVFWKSGFQEFIKRLCNVVNAYTPPDKNFHPIFLKDGYFVDGLFVDIDNCDYLRVVYPDESLEYTLHKEYMKIKNIPDRT